MLLNGWDGRICFTVNGMNLDKKYLNTIGLTQLVMETLPKQTSLFGEEELTSSWRISMPAILNGRESGKGTEDERHLLSRRCLESFGRLSRPGSWAKTFSALLELRMEGLVFSQVQADLEAEGYEVQPYVLLTCSVNAPHRRGGLVCCPHPQQWKRTT